MRSDSRSLITPGTTQICTTVTSPRELSNSRKPKTIASILTQVLEQAVVRSSNILLSFPPPASAATTAAAATAIAAAASLLVLRSPLVLLLLLPYWLVVSFLQVPVVFPKRFILWCTPECSCRQSDIGRCNNCHKPYGWLYHCKV
jgi:hypothetical protein